MAALVFPASPNLGDVFPDPPISGVSQWEWDGSKWNSTTLFVRLNDLTAFNSYVWPPVDGVPGTQLTTDGAGNLTWSGEADLSIQALGITPNFDGVSQNYTLVKLGTGIFFTPIPSTNLVVFLGGVPQTPTVSYTVSGNQITFLDPPPIGTTFYAISNVTI